MLAQRVPISRRAGFKFCDCCFVCEALRLQLTAHGLAIIGASRVRAPAINLQVLQAQARVLDVFLFDVATNKFQSQFHASGSGRASAQKRVTDQQLAGVGIADDPLE